MKKRWSTYFLAGLIFGAAYWHYLSATSHFFNDIFLNVTMEENALIFWASFSIVLLVSFGVWLIPAILPAVYEFRHSKMIRFSILAVVIVFISAVLGYYINYIYLFAFVGLPHMEYYLVFGQRGPTFWQDWAELFPKLILYDFLKWTVVGLIVGGFAGLLTSSFYSFWVKKTNSVMPA